MNNGTLVAVTAPLRGEEAEVEKHGVLWIVRRRVDVSAEYVRKNGRLWDCTAVKDAFAWQWYDREMEVAGNG